MATTWNDLSFQDISRHWSAIWGCLLAYLTFIQFNKKKLHKFE